MTYTGIVVIRKCFEGSKSEGNYAFLDTGQTEYRLFRVNESSMNDLFFRPFDGKRVEIEGTVIDYWLSVSNISEAMKNDATIVGRSNVDAEREEPDNEIIGEYKADTEQKDITDEEEMQ